MMKRTKMFMMSLILCIVMLLSMTVKASTIEDSICIESITYDYVTSAEELLELADAGKCLTRGISDDEELIVDVEQLIAERTYSDGSIVKEYAKSSIQLVESSSRAIDNASQ